MVFLVNQLSGSFSCSCHLHLGRRRALTLLGGTLASLCLGLSPALALEREVQADHGSREQQGSALPILMFHKVRDLPRSPEELSPQQLALLFAYLWEQGFAPLNASDILLNRVNNVLPPARLALGITVDDAHPSALFARGGQRQGQGQDNAASFLDILLKSSTAAGLTPRASFFVSGPSYFGGKRKLDWVLDQLEATPGIELGYHTLGHKSMAGFGYQQTLQLIEEQMESFRRHSALERVSRILAYPYGLPPAPEGLRALTELGFLGGLCAFPGRDEAGYARLPVCRYGEKGLLSERFLLPRVNIGAFRQLKKGTGAQPYAPIDPLDDFRKDIPPLTEIYRRPL